MNAFHLGLRSAVCFLLLICLGSCRPATPTATPAPATETPAPTPANPKLVRLASLEYPPFCGENLEDQGVLTAIIVAAYQSMGYEVTVDFLPWARALQMSQDGEYDGLYSTWYRPEREEWFWFPDPMMPNEMGFYKRTSDVIPYERLEDLSGYNIGIVRGYAYPPEFVEATYLTTDEGVDEETNLRKLHEGRVDLILIDHVIAVHLINTKFPEYAEELEWLPPALETLPQYLAISKRAPDGQAKLEAFNTGLRQITENGTLQEIVTRHGFAE